MARDYARQRNPNAGGGGRNSRRDGGDGRRGGASASRSRGGGGNNNAAPAHGMPGWVYLILGLSIGLAVAAIVYIGRPSSKITLGSGPASSLAAPQVTANPLAGNTKSANAATTGTTPSAPGATTARDDGGRKSIALPPKQPSRFAFYEMLPSYEVVIPRESSKAALAAQQQQPQQAKPAASASAANAPAPNAALGAANVPPDVKQALAEPGQYLIQVGAYRSRDEADKNRASLALIGVESRIEQVTIDQKDTWFRVRIGPESTLAKAQEILDRLESNDIKGMLVKVKS